MHLGAVRTQGRTDLVDDAVDDVQVDEGRFGGEPLVDPRGGSEAEFLNADETGSHTPGVSVECAQWLATEREITGLGVETVGVDAGLAGGFDPAFPVHYHFLGNDKYGLTSLRNLGSLPPTGAVIVVSPLPIVGGTGSPSRVLAIVES